MRERNNNIKFVYILVLFVFSSVGVVAQDYNKFLHTNSQNITRIDSVLRAEINAKGRADIVQIGDSHIQSGYITSVIRDAFQRKYGDSGRGWESFHRLYHSNSYDDIRIKSTPRKFAGRTISKHNLKYPISIAGIEVQAKDKANVKIDIDSKDKYFNTILINRGKDSSPLVCDTSTSKFKEGRDSSYWVIDTISFANPTTKVSLHTLKDKRHSRIYSGVYMYNDNKGVIVNTIGVNGATFKDYDTPQYMDELSRLKPCIIIVSLGTNDSYTTRFDRLEFRHTLLSFVDNLKRANPNALLIFTTASPCYIRSYTRKKVKYKGRYRYVRRKVYQENKNTEVVADEIINLSKDNNIIVIDLYRALGGVANLKNLLKTKQLFRDRVHYTVDGYTKQGEIIAKALGLDTSK